MEPIEWAIAAGLVALATYLSGCGDEEKESTGNFEPWTTDATTPDAAADAVDIPADEYVAPKDAGPKDKPGFNSKLLKTGCDIADIDISGQTLVGVCRNSFPNENYRKLFVANVDDPKRHYAPVMYPALTNEYDDVGNGNLITYTLVPEQVIRAGAGVYQNDYIVPFSGTNEDASCMSGLSILSAVDGYEKHMSFFDTFDFPIEDAGGPTMLKPCGVKSAVFDEATGLWTPATVSTEDGEIGILRGYDIGSYQPLEPGGKGGYPAFLNGRNPSAIAKVLNPLDPGDVEGQYAAVLNSRGYGAERPPDSCTVEAIGDDTFGCDNASIDIFRLSSPVAEGEKPVTVIDLGVEETVPLSELPMTDDMKYAVVAANQKLMIVNLQTGEIDGEVNNVDIDAPSVRDVAVSGYKAYVAVGKTIYIYDFDFSKTKTANPVLMDEIDVEFDVGSIAVDEDGIIYAAVADEADPSKGHTRIFSINPKEV